MADKLTAERRANLDKLATYLEGLPKRYRHFSMNYWLRSDNHDAVAKYARENGGVATCGTVACAVGHGPAAGVLVPERYIEWIGPERSFVSWRAYSQVFVEPFTIEHDWCFSGDWEDADNHHYGAAARIRYLLTNGGAPAGFDRPRRKWRAAYAPYRIDAKAPADA